ncbi:uncharacterized protein LOC143461076 isoform X1 [Clavelina lepadiformis]|uniref:uncharacterized protein LOC143461076 isoform X1 n=1 Tax=Clavelina lepadiformis TaxID=159417 RepID=UPI0040429674
MQSSYAVVANLLPIITGFLATLVQGRVTYSNDKQENGETKCQGKDGEYFCQVGSCCCEDGCCTGEGCCTYYYQLWWFWLIWGVIILMSCFCAYHHRRKRRAHRSSRGRRRNRESGPYAGVCNYPGPPLDNSVLGYCKLPVYDDVIRIPPTASPPPPYSSRRPINTVACLEPNQNGETVMRIIPCNLTSSMLSLHSLSYYMPSLVAQSSVADLPARNNRMSELILPHGVTDEDTASTAESIFKEADELPPKEEPIAAIEADVSIEMEDIPIVTTPECHEGCSYEPAHTDTVEIDHARESDYSSVDDSSDDEWAFGIDSNNNNHVKSIKRPVFGRLCDGSGDGNAQLQENNDKIPKDSGIILHLEPRDSD